MRRGNYSFLADSLAISNTQFIYLLSRCIQRGSKLLDTQSFYRADQQPTSQHGTVLHSLASRARAAGPGREQDFTQLDSAQGQLGLGFIEQQVARFH